MADDRLVLRRIAWGEICPWLMIFRCFRLAISLPILFLATIGTFLTPVGERVGLWLLPDKPIAAPADVIGLVERKAIVPPIVADLKNFGQTWKKPGDDVTGVYWTFVQPFWRIFDRTSPWSVFLRSLFIAIWIVAVWSLFGAAITRIAVVQLGRDERVQLSDAVRHALRNYGWNFAAPLFPLLGVVLLSIPLAVVGLLMRLSIGALLAGLIWPLVLLAGLAMAILLLGLIGGWPLMWPTISAEEQSDSFEAFSRSFGYTFQRPLQYLFYVLLAVLFGKLCWILVANFAGAILSLTHWSTSFGSRNPRLTDILYNPVGKSTLDSAAAGLIHWWEWFVLMIAQAFNFSYFFCVAAAIYLLLRRHVDQTDFDEVYVPDEATRYGLPPLRTSPEGIPEAED